MGKQKAEIKNMNQNQKAVAVMLGWLAAFFFFWQVGQNLERVKTEEMLRNCGTNGPGAMTYDAR